MRLQKQQKSFRKRAWEMLRRGLKTMDELDEAEELIPGIVMVTGPTGSGKSSTMDAYVD